MRKADIVFDKPFKLLEFYDCKDSIAVSVTYDDITMQDIIDRADQDQINRIFGSKAEITAVAEIVFDNDEVFIAATSSSKPYNITAEFYLIGKT